MQATLVDQARRGDAEAFDSLARMVGDRCMAIAFRILRDADLAEDAVQTAFITAWRELRSLRNPDLFEPWLHRILTHACYAEARHRTRWAAGIRLLPVDPVHGLDNTLTVDDRDQLERACKAHRRARAGMVFLPTSTLNFRGGRRLVFLSGRRSPRIRDQGVRASSRLMPSRN